MKRKKSKSFKMDGTFSPKRKSQRSPKRKSPRSPSKSKSPPKRTLDDVFNDLLEKFRKKIHEVVQMKEDFSNIIEELNADFVEYFNNSMEQIMEDELCKYTIFEETGYRGRDENIRLIIKNDDDNDIDDDKFKKLGKSMTKNEDFSHQCKGW